MVSGFCCLLQIRTCRQATGAARVLQAHDSVRRRRAKEGEERAGRSVLIVLVQGSILWTSQFSLVESPKS